MGQDEVKELQLVANDLRKSIAWMDLVLANLSESICVVDAVGTVLFANDACAGMVGKARILMLGEKVWDVLDIKKIDTKEPAITGAALVAAWGPDASAKLGGKYHHEQQVIELSAHFVPNLEQMILVMRDVTREQEIDLLKTEFITLASHQLRTPMSAINWFSEMLLRKDAGELNSDQQEFVQNIVDSSKRMTDLVNDLLNVSRVESGGVIIEPKPTDVKVLVQTVADEFSRQIKEKQHTLQLDIDPKLPKIQLDPDLIKQAYITLLTNAIKYTKSGGQITIKVGVEGDKLMSRIIDTGYGIPKEQQDNIFQKFFRAENILKIETDGTGLGLYLVKTIIESCDGEMGFESVENKGSTFWFSLPLTGMKARKGSVRLSDVA